ncbi:MAG: Lrp/AsnC family transcriptional regulator [Pseudomonadota bacterium]
MNKAIDIVDLDHRIVLATQAGLPLDPQPYHRIAEQLGVEASQVQQRMQQMLEDGRMRRIAAVPNHYKLGYVANGMSVWNVPDERIDELGERLGALDYVSHCYRRPRHLPEWPYNLFAMVHGTNRSEVMDKVRRIALILDDADLGHDVLFSTGILKKTGMRFKG